MLLGDVADIRAGMVITRKKAMNLSEVKAMYNMFTLKNIDSLNEPYEQFQSNDVLSPQHFTQVGDILFRLNYPYSAVYIDEAKSGLLIPSTFAVIKVQSNYFSPEYVAWYMNTAFVKKELEKGQAGTKIPSTNKATLRAIPIEPIELEKQRNIVKLYKLHLQEKQLLTSLIKEKEKLFQAQTNKVLQGI
ncbi:restriction endonuclease subunit S [Lysinibacillus telephonicus]|uniref:restriction endonuclease subunit S n=1 Tax=Lysinibacillus telephonicus TaxID=1714840 RepID=UPI0031FCCA4F